MDTSPEQVTVSEAASIIGCCRMTVHMLIEEGKLKATHVGRMADGRKRLVRVLRQDCQRLRKEVDD